MFSYRNKISRLIFAALLASLMGRATAASEFSSYVVLGENGAAMARVLIDAPTCPAISFDNHASPMALRAGAATMPLRQEHAKSKESKASVFAVLSCEKLIPPGTTSAMVLGRALPIPKATIKRIVVIGDTGCRLKKSSDSYQACNDADQYPFAQVAKAAARWKPDLVVHVGDYEYRESACPKGNAGCAGSSWGYGWDAWRDDFFSPAAALLQAAPWVMARGNHEICSRAGQGYWRFLDPRPLLAGRDCIDPAFDDGGDFSDPYAVPIGNDAQLLVIDSAATDDKGFDARAPGLTHYRNDYRKLEALSQRTKYSFGVNHHPILGFSATTKADGSIKLRPGDLGLQQAFGARDGAPNPMLLPARINAMLSGHVHLWEQVSFAGDYPSQFITGFSGTEEESLPLPARLPPGSMPAPGAIVDHLSTWGKGFGFMTMERSGFDEWKIKIWDQHGVLQNTCHLSGKKSRCKQMQVATGADANPLLQGDTSGPD